MPWPIVSVLLPMFNAAATVEQAVRSMLHQSYQDWELCLIDDGSTDDTVQIVLRLVKDEPRARLLQQPHAGIVTALNHGIERSRGRFIARMDADDVAYPDRLSEQVKFLVEQPELGLVGTLVEFGGDPLRAGGYALHVDWINGLTTHEEIYLNRFVEAPFAHPSVLFRRELVTFYGGYRAGDFPEDYELWLRWLSKGVRMAKVPKKLLTWHDFSGRLSRSDPRYRVEAFYRCKARYLAEWLKSEVGDSRSILAWGAGRPTRKRSDLLEEEGVAIRAYIDIDPRKVNRILGGKPVLGLEQLPPARESFVLCYVGKRGARELARRHLLARDFVEGKDFLAVA